MPRDMHALGDEQLAERARAGDTRAFGVLWERHAGAGRAAARQFSAIADPDDLVAEAYLHILRAVQRGGGPREAFRPYLYRTIRNIALRWRPGASTQPLDDAIDLADDRPDPEAAALQSTITVRAFRTLPERWQTVLWYTEVEGMQPAEAAPHLGLSANGAAALAYRAREGLKAAWLQAHVSDARVPENCRWASARMGDRARGALTARQQKRFDTHVADCTRCSILVEEVDELSGRLAGLVLPLTLGGTAGSALLAELVGGGTSVTAANAAAPSDSATTSAASSTTSTGVVMGAVVGSAIAAISVVALVLSSLSSSPTAQPVAEESRPPAVAPVPAPSPVPESSDRDVEPDKQIDTGEPLVDPTPDVEDDAPARPKPAPPVVVPPVEPRTPTIAQPQSGALLASSTVALSGTGTSGHSIDVRATYGDSGSRSQVVGRTTVTPAGTWMLSTSDLPDGPVRLEVRESNTLTESAPATVLVHLDTLALPPEVDALDTTGLRLLPVVTGTAEPGAIVQLLDDTDALRADGVVDESGQWSILLPDLGGDPIAVAITQVDPAGNRSEPTAVGPFTFERPEVLAPLDGAIIERQPGGTAVDVAMSGAAGEHVQVLIDGEPTGNIHTLANEPIVRVTRPLESGVHTIGVRYFDPATGRFGVLHTVQFVID